MMSEDRRKPVVLVVDDDESWRDSAKTFFSCHDGGYRTDSASNLDTALRVFHQYPDPIIGFVDINMQHGPTGGLDIIQYAHEYLPHRSVIYAVTGNNWTVELDDEVIRRGGQELLIKDPNNIFQRMLTRVRHASVVEQIDAALRDPLTNLKNRKVFEEDVRIELEMAKIRKKPEILHLIALDVDKLWPVNDTYGHLAGDKCLQMVAKVIGEEVRPSDHPARRSGDEFLACIVGAERDVVLRIARSIEERVKNTPVEVRPGLYANVGVTWGLAELRHDQISYPLDAQLSDFMEQADKALGEKKPSYDKAQVRSRGK